MPVIKVPHHYSGDNHLAEAYRMGWWHGDGLAHHNVPRAGDRIARDVDWTGLGPVVSRENAHDYHELLCFAAEEHSRQFSPFEHTARGLNDPAEFLNLPEEDCEGLSEELWEAFDAGTADVIRAQVATYALADYGFNEEEEATR